MASKIPRFESFGFFLWGHMKSLVYAKKSDSENELLERIMDAAQEIRDNPQMILDAIVSLNRRAEICIDNGGGHFEQLL